MTIEGELVHVLYSEYIRLRYGTFVQDDPCGQVSFLPDHDSFAFSFHFTIVITEFKKKYELTSQ